MARKIELGRRIRLDQAWRVAWNVLICSRTKEGKRNDKSNVGDEYAMKSCLLRLFRAFSEADVHRHRALTLLDPSDSEILINHQAQSQVA